MKSHSIYLSSNYLEYLKYLVSVTLYTYTHHPALHLLSPTMPRISDLGCTCQMTILTSCVLAYPMGRTMDKDATWGTLRDVLRDPAGSDGTNFPSTTRLNMISQPFHRLIDEEVIITSWKHLIRAIAEENGQIDLG